MLQCEVSAWIADTAGSARPARGSSAGALVVVPGAGLEPAHPNGQILLRDPRLPVPSSRHLSGHIPDVQIVAPLRGVTHARVAGFGRLGGVDSARRVVIAEDEALIRLDLKEMLQEDGYEVVGEAGDGEAAVRPAAELKPDLVILDVKMPVLDGISAAERISAERIAPVVILTAFSQRELVQRATEAGAMAYLVKPFTKSDLAPAIEMAVSRYTELRALEAEVAGLQERLETRKVVDRAKGLLQEAHGWSEPEAFRWIQKASMDRRLTMRAVADTVVEELSRQRERPDLGRQ